MNELFKDLPAWFGTVPQWGMFLLLLIAVIRTSPQWLSTWASLKVARSNRNRERIIELEKQVHECQRECEEHKKYLREEINGLKQQRLAEQATIMRAILRMSNDPEVERQLHLLETIQATLNPILKGGK